MYNKSIYIYECATARCCTLWQGRHEAEFGGAAFHLCAQESVSLEALCGWLRAAGFKIQEVSAHTFCARIRNAGDTHPLFAMKALLSTPASLLDSTVVTAQAKRFETSLSDRAVGVVGGGGELPARAMTMPALMKAMEFLLSRSGPADAGEQGGNKDETTPPN